MSDTAGGHRGYHDIGGQASGAVDQAPHDQELWEKRVDALMSLLSGPKHKLMRGDELRRGIESLGADVYDRLSYYERWISSITLLMVEKGIVGQDELDARVAKLKADGVGRP